jgi:hypothetical protein
MDHTVKGTRYEYIQITVSNTMKPLYIFYYENSGWILEEASEVKERKSNVTLNFRRDLINKNRDEEANPNCWSRL